MERFIIHENILRFERLLTNVTDRGQRSMLVWLLDAERRKSATQDSRPRSGT